MRSGDRPPRERRGQSPEAYEIPQENQIVHADGITFVRIPAYDSPCFVAERRALELE